MLKCTVSAIILLQRGEAMRSCTVSISEIMNEPNHNLSAKHWCDIKVPKERSGSANVNVNVNLEKKEVTTCE